MKHIKSLMQKVGKGEGGFTLIELLIVIVILGIIAAVVVLNVGGFFGTGVKQAALMDKDAVQTAVLAAMIDGNCDQIAEDTSINPTTHVACQELIPTYVQGTLKGTWILSSSGQIKTGNYTASGKTCEWDGISMNCTG